jgi:hypothetical protein
LRVAASRIFVKVCESGCAAESGELLRRIALHCVERCFERSDKWRLLACIDFAQLASLQGGRVFEAHETCSCCSAGVTAPLSQARCAALDKLIDVYQATNPVADKADSDNDDDDEKTASDLQVTRSRGSALGGTGTMHYVIALLSCASESMQTALL